MRFIAPNYTDNQVIISLMVQVAFIDILLEAGRVMNLVVNRAIKASGDARYPLLSIIVIQWIFILPLIYVLTTVLNLGLIGIWLALAIDEFVRGINLLIRWKSKRWQAKSIKLNNSLLNQ
jgi:Na+-driven multidrug efflux pump